MSTSSKANHQGTESESVPPRLAALLLAPLLLLLALPVGAQTWVRYGGAEGSVLLVDTTSVRVVSARIRRAWVMTNFAEPFEGVRSVRALEEIDCEEARRRVLQTTYFRGAMGTGGVVETHHSPEPWRFIAPGTNAEALMDYVCSLKK